MNLTELSKAYARRAGAATVAVLVFSVQAEAQVANETGQNVNLLNLLSPFLSLNATPTGQATLQANLNQAVAINNAATPSQQSLAISDKNLLNAASNTVVGLSGTFGPAYNLAGGLPAQAAINGITPQQPVGGLGPRLGAIFDTGINSGTNGPLAKTISLLVNGYNFTSSDVGSKNYFANGTVDGTVTAVAPAGFTLPTFNGLPNKTNSVYDLAYGVKNTDPGQGIFGDSRPVQVAPNRINQFDPTALSGLTTNPAFPSGHTNYAYTDSILIAMMVPEQYQNMLSRASEYANSRIVLGVHYPLDIIASRTIATYDLAQGLTNPAYINNAAMTGTAINLPSLLTQATPELRSYLSSQCGGTVAACATSSVNTANNPYVPSAANQATYVSNLTYGLPTLSLAQAPAEAAPAGGPDASILLAPLYGGSTAAAQALAPGGGLYGSLQTSTINQIILNTETNALAALFGTSWSYWSRVDLYSAAGYFQNVTGTITLASADNVTTNVTVGSNGRLGGTGTISGTLTNNGVVAPGNPVGTLTVNGTYAQGSNATLLAQQNQIGLSTLKVNGTASIAGALQIAAVSGFTPSFGQSGTVLSASQGVTGTFSNVFGSPLTGSLFYQPIYSPQTVSVMVAAPLASFSLTPNERAIAGTLDQLHGSSNTTIQSVLNTLYPQEVSGGLGASLDQLAPQNTFSTSLFGQRFAGFLADQFSGRAGALRAGATGFSVAANGVNLAGSNTGALNDMLQSARENQLAATDGGWGMFAPGSPWGGFVSGQLVIGDRTLTPNQTNENFTTGGVTAGIDYRVAPQTVLGLAGSYFTGDVDTAGGTTNGRGGAVSFYGTSQSGPWYMDGFLGVGLMDFDTSRSLSIGGVTGTAKGTPTGNFFATGANVGYRMDAPTSWGLLHWGPVGEFQFNTVGIDQYAETGLGALSTTVGNRNVNSIQTGLGGELSLETLTSWGRLTPHLRATWQHEFGDAAENATASFAAVPSLPFVLTSSPLARDFAAVTAGVSAVAWQGVTLSADYSGEVGRNNQTVHQVLLQVRVAF